MITHTDTVVALRATTTIFKEIEDAYDRITKRAYDIFLKRGGGDDVLAVEDWIAAEREMIVKPPAHVTESKDHIEITYDLAGINPDDLEVVLTPHSILLWSPDESDLRGVFRLLSLPSRICSERAEVRLDGSVLLLKAPVAP